METLEVFKKEWYEGYYASANKTSFDQCNYIHCPYPENTSEWDDWCRGYEAEDLKPIQVYLVGTTSGIECGTQ